MTAERLIAELRSPACYGAAVGEVQIVQTHLSIVCLAADRVWKLKKAVALPFVDFSTLDRRRAACRDEVRLNRRLCPDTYLGCAALRRVDGALRFAPVGDDQGESDVDVAVVMRRLPADRMLDLLVRERRVARHEIEALARHVAAFHASAERGPGVVAAGDPRRLAGFAAANFTETDAIRDHGLPPALLTALARASASSFATILPAMVRRAHEGHVVDGHGDLHARNVCMTEPPAVYDCIEFEPAFRCGDVATENAFLAMDLRYRGAPDLAAAYVAAYVAASDDREQPALLPPLIAYRAMVRAKVAALAAAETELPAADRDGARDSARRHLLLAAAVLTEQAAPRWLVVCGPPASGKTGLCAALAATTSWPHVSTDVVRKELAGLAPTARGGDAIYGTEFSQRTYAAVLAKAATATADGARAVLLDGNFPTRDHRARAAAAARTAGAEPVVVHVHVDPSLALARAAARRADPTTTSDAGPEQLAALQARFVAPAADEGPRIVQLDGASPTGDLAAALLAALL